MCCASAFKFIQLLFIVAQLEWWLNVECCGCLMRRKDKIDKSTGSWNRNRWIFKWSLSYLLMMTVNFNSDQIVLCKSICFFLCIKYKLLPSFCRLFGWKLQPFMYNIYPKFRTLCVCSDEWSESEKISNARTTLFNRTANGKFQNVFFSYSVHNCLCFGNAMFAYALDCLTTKREEKLCESRNRHTNLLVTGFDWS